MSGHGSDNPFRVANIDVGHMIKCIVCNVNRYRNRFSNKQMDTYKTAVNRERHGGPAASLPRCIDCTAGNITELECTGCLLFKPLDDFSGQQRKKPDQALCIPCVQETEDRLPDLQEAVAEERIRDQESHRMPGGSSVTGASSSINASYLPSQTQSASGGGIYLPDERGSTWGGNSVRSPSPTNTEISEVNTISAHSGTGTRGNWTKQGAYVQPIQARVQNRIAREEEQKRHNYTSRSHDDDSDSDEEEFEL